METQQIRLKQCWISWSGPRFAQLHRICSVSKNAAAGDEWWSSGCGEWRKSGKLLEKKKWNFGWKGWNFGEKYNFGLKKENFGLKKWNFGQKSTNKTKNLTGTGVRELDTGTGQSRYSRFFPSRFYSRRPQKRETGRDSRKIPVPAGLYFSHTFFKHYFNFILRSLPFNSAEKILKCADNFFR